MVVTIRTLSMGQIVLKLLVLERNTWNQTTVCNLFLLTRNTLYQITVQKNSGEKTTIQKNVNKDI